MSHPTPPAAGDSDAEIAVATPHVRLVVPALEDAGVHARVYDVSDELGLSLLRLPAAEVAGAVRSRPAHAADDRLGALLDLLYEQFGERYGGWVPTFGRNRTIDSLHNITGGTEGSPTQVSDRLAPRDSEPGDGVRVGVADTAVYTHPWYGGAVHSAPAALLDGGATPPYQAGHATFVCGLVLQAAPGATIEVRRVLGEDAAADSWTVARKLVTLARSGLDVLNLSFGCFTGDNKAPLVLATALDRMPADVVVVAAAGNHGETELAERPMWPAAMEEVVAVGAVDRTGRRPAWSPDAARLPWIDVVATGVDVQSTYLPVVRTGDDPAEERFGELAAWNGTSFAAAAVSGAIAARTVPGQLGAAQVVRQLLRDPPHWWEQRIPWLA